ncbi:hypothetical protein JQR85_02640 [Stutzerimonas urumqiensis]|uniref:hypothetical protein n=1 Tax=Stutzerimonas urumqiensis TaxID=638269 RepID=UPI003DA68654
MTTRDHKFEINYIFRNDPMAEVVDATEETLPQHEAVRLLLEKHHGEIADPSGVPLRDAKPEDILHFAQANQITDVRVSKVHIDPRSDTPGHYKQP